MLSTRAAVLLVVALACCCWPTPVVQAQQQRPASGVGISGAWPSSLSQYVQTTVRVTLNTSACGQWGRQDAADGAQLVLQHVTAKGDSLAFSTSAAASASALYGASNSGSGSVDCTSFDFPVLLDGSSKHGNISARLLLPRLGLNLQLQEPIMVHVPLLLAAVNSSLTVKADSRPFAVGVRLNHPAPAGGVAVQLQLDDPAAAKVDPAALFWPEGSQGRRDFSVSLLAAPDKGVLTARLVHPTGGAVLHPSEAVVQALVDSPVVSFTTNLGFYRGSNGSISPRITFNLTGASAFPSEFAFTTFLLRGSRPELLPCHPLAPSCSVADQEAVDNVTLSGSRYITPGQRGISPADLPIVWGRLPSETELRVGVRITCLSNCRVAEQAGDVAAIIFGTPPGHCPPGAVLAAGAGDLASNSSGGGSDRPTYTHVAALQELALVLDAVDHDDSSQGMQAGHSANHRRRLLNVSKSSSSTTSNGTRPLPAATNSASKSARNSTRSSSSSKKQGTAQPPAPAATPTAATAAANASSSTLDLDPPFRPLVDRYLALLPPGPAEGQLMMSSSRWGDVVVVDTTACGELDSARYTVVWEQGQQLWREYYPLTGQKVSCWIRVHVFTRLSADGSNTPPPQQDSTAPSITTTPSSSSSITTTPSSTSNGQQGLHSLTEQGPALKDPSHDAPVSRPAASRRPLLQVWGSSSSSSSSTPAAGPSSTVAAASSSSDATNSSSSASGMLQGDAAWLSNGRVSSSNGSSSSSSSSSPSVWALPSDFVLYRSYTIRFVPLRPPEQLTLKSITFSNNATTVIACGVPTNLEHLFVQPGVGGLQAAAGGVVGDKGSVSGGSSGGGNSRPSSIMSSNYAAASARAAGVERNSSSSSSSRGMNASAAPSSLTAAAAAGPEGSGFKPLSLGSTGLGDQQAAANAVNAAAAAAAGSSSSSGLSGMPAALVAAPGVDVQVAYLLMKPPGSNSSSAAEDAMAAAKVPNRLRLQQFSVLDRASNRTIVWSRYTSADCAQDRYILLPIAQLKADMKMIAELVDSDGFAAGVKIAMSAAAVALPGAGGADGAGSSNSTGDGNGAGSSGSSISQLGVPSEGSSSVSSWLLGQKFLGGGFGGSSSPVAAAAAAAAVDGGKGYGGATGSGKALDDHVWCSSGGSSSGNSTSSSGGSFRGLRGVRVGDVGSSGSDGSGGCRMQLPGLTAELPIILTADEGRSSKTYTMLLYSNATAAAAVHDLVLPQEAAAAVGSGGGSSGMAGSGSSQAADAAAFSAAFFADRPPEWPKSPAQAPQCSVCPNGTYSTRTDALECKVCPPGKYAASPFSTTCLYCPPGTFSYYWGAPTCRTCLPGTFAAAAGSLFCDICRDGTTTRAEGATYCEVAVSGGSSSSSRLDAALGGADVAILLSFGLLLDGTSLESVSRSLTGINGSSEGIVGVLVRGDTASALNISLGSVQVLAVQQIGSRQLLVNVSAALPVSTDQAAAAAAAQQDLSADPLIQRLIDDPNTFLRTTQTLGAESASVQDITTQMTQRAKWAHQLQLHAILWPTLAGCLLAVGLGSWGWRRRRRRQQQLAQMASGRGAEVGGNDAGGGGGGGVAVGAIGGAGLFGSSLQQRSTNRGAQGHLFGLGRRTGGRNSAGAAAAAGAPSGPGWFYGDGFMVGGGGSAAARGSVAGAGAGDDNQHHHQYPDLGRTSLNSSDAGDGAGRRSMQRAGAGGSMLRLLHHLLSSRIRIVFRVQGGGAGTGAGGGSSSSGASSPVSGGSSSPAGRSSYGGSEADSMERGGDEYRVKVVVGGGGGGGDAHVEDCGSGLGSDVDGRYVHHHHQHSQQQQQEEWEESYAARLRAQQQQRLQ